MQYAKGAVAIRRLFFVHCTATSPRHQHPLTVIPAKAGIQRL